MLFQTCMDRYYRLVSDSGTTNGTDRMVHHTRNHRRSYALPQSARRHFREHYGETTQDLIFPSD
jgi:hypothetical protein